MRARKLGVGSAAAARRPEKGKEPHEQGPTYNPRSPTSDTPAVPIGESQVLRDRGKGAVRWSPRAVQSGRGFGEFLRPGPVAPRLPVTFQLSREVPRALLEEPPAQRHHLRV